MELSASLTQLNPFIHICSLLMYCKSTYDSLINNARVLICRIIHTLGGEKGGLVEKISIGANVRKNERLILK